jgi:glycosyltransferase involved in cell wall biosynthesis
MKLTVLSVAYPLAPCGPDAAGGAEQVLMQIDRALVRAGHRSLVIAREGSQVEGELLAIPPVRGAIDEAAQRTAHAHVRAAIGRALDRWRVDLTHFHGVDFHAYLPAAALPMTATLHLPPSWYPPEVFDGRVSLVCVSRSQRQSCPASAAVVTNGVDVERFGAPVSRRGFALAMGRLCPEKAFHRALDAAASANIPLVLAGELYAYPEHIEHFEREIRPRLDARRRFVGPVGLARKRRLLAAARCLVVASRVEETSSLVAMEALASGTPVVAMRTGALPEIVEHGRTGFLVDGVEEMADAMRRAGEIRPDVCRSAARERFTASRMCGEYLDWYERLAMRASVHVA